MAVTRATSKKAKKKNHGEEEDRLSDLSDCILLHILSFLPEIRFCIRTTLLSKRWNNLWASVPCLSLQSASLTCLFPLFNISNSLKTLDLKYFSNLHLLQDFTLPSLTTLHLFGCSFNGKSVSIDPFVGLFNLKSLRLVGSIGTLVNFKITGPQLVSLTIVGPQWCKVEILAPKLRFFGTKWVPLGKFSHLEFPLLEMAYIDLLILDAKKAPLDLITMFRGLYNARSLVLSSGMIMGLMGCPNVFEDQSSPFVRLKTLKVHCPALLVSSFNMPDIMMKYFGENITVKKIKG